MKLMDRDVVASMNIAYKGWSRFCHPRGLPDEAMKGNVILDKYQEPLILRVNGSKLDTHIIAQVTLYKDDDKLIEPLFQTRI
jgi:hypothetical protein